MAKRLGHASKELWVSDWLDMEHKVPAELFFRTRQPTTLWFEMKFNGNG
jgi:hypothetical protein